MEDNYDLKKLVNKKKKKRVNSRRKGNTFATKICKMFNERFNTKEFCKTPGSGAFATIHSLPKHLQIYGDIITIEKFKYTIECKKGYNKESINSIFNYSSEFWKFITQIERDAEESGRQPLLIFQQDRQPILAVCREDSFPHVEPYVKFEKYKMFLFANLLETDDFYWLGD
tara:strand:- start:2183 stop:2695 length:513 start_codon:yes stop_codon:yes gene_type:complete